MENKYQVMPDLTEEEYEALKQDIAERGVQIPVEYDEDGNILDGYHRVRACKELGIEDWPSVIREGMSEEEKLEHAYKLNVKRRHLSREKKMGVVKQLAEEVTEDGDRKYSTRDIADITGIPKSTVSDYFHELSELGQLNLPDKVQGKDGKSRPSTKPKREAPEQPTRSKEEAELEAPQGSNSKPKSIYLHRHADKEKAQEIVIAAKSGDEKAQQDVERLSSGQTTVKNAHRRLEQKRQKEQAEEPPIPDGKYRILYADPPWKYNDKRDGYTTRAEDHYPTMTIQELCALPVKDLAHDNSVMFLWVPSPILEESFEVVNAWGFNYKTSLIWYKVKHNMGHYSSVRHELLLICTRGSCLPDSKKLINSVQEIERSDKHSEKPEEFREIIDTLYTYGPRIELFARKEAEGWDVWGNEIHTPES